MANSPQDALEISGGTRGRAPHLVSWHGIDDVLCADAGFDTNSSQSTLDLSTWATGGCASPLLILIGAYKTKSMYTAIAVNRICFDDRVGADAFRWPCPFVGVDFFATAAKLAILRHTHAMADIWTDILAAQTIFLVDAEPVKGHDISDGTAHGIVFWLVSTIMG